MDTTTLIQELREVQTESYTWTFAFYAVKKRRDGIEMEWNVCNMSRIAAQIEVIREHLLKKPLADKPVLPYSPFLSDKEAIGALEQSDEMIREQLQDVFLNIQNGQNYSPKDFVSGIMPKITGYAFYGEPSEAEKPPMLFMRRGNPFLSGARFYNSEDDTAAFHNDPIIKLTPAVDFLAVGNACYFFAASVEKDFAFENRHFIIAQKYLDKLAAAEVIGNYDFFESVVMRSKNARKFLDFNEEIMDYISRLPIIARAEFLEKYGVAIDKNGRMNTYDPEQCELVIDLLCGRSCLDPLGRLSVGNKIMVRE